MPYELPEHVRFRLALEALRAQARQAHTLEQDRRSRVALLRRVRLMRSVGGR